jgi:anti-sigma factor RsiW
MRCAEAQPLIDCYLDGELDLVRNVEVERHLETCRECGPIRQSALELRDAVRNVSYFRAPGALAQCVRAIAETPKQRDRDTRTGFAQAWSWTAVAAAIVLVAFAAFEIAGRFAPSHEQLVAREVVSAHVRSLMANHLTDVTSTDQHTVKPWFNGKLDFAPPVVNLTNDGFPLAGGRLDYLDGRAVAALVYQRRLHSINLFIWPTQSANSEPSRKAQDGYNISEWNQNGMTFWAVSDLSSNELQTFVNLLRK